MTSRNPELSGQFDDRAQAELDLRSVLLNAWIEGFEKGFAKGYAKGFLKGYAKALGLPESEVVLSPSLQELIAKGSKVRAIDELGAEELAEITERLWQKYRPRLM